MSEQLGVVSAMIELASLLYRRPGRSASDEAIAVWYQEKGRMHERIADLGGPEVAQERANAAASYELARRLSRQELTTS